MQNRNEGNQSKQKTAVIIGCGISGASAADELIKLGYKIIILEKNKRVGGKLKSIDNQDLGAMVLTANYPAIDTINSQHLTVERVLSNDDASLNQVVYGKVNPSIWDKLTYASNLCWQFSQFAYDVFQYNHASPLTPTISNYEIDFESYCQNRQALANIMKIWLPGMGYGTLSTNYLFRVINYMGYTTLPSLCLGKKLFGNCLYTIHGGYQKLVEVMVKERDVRTGVVIENILRKNNKVMVSYSYKNNSILSQPSVLEADLLVLTMSPYHWKSLGMELNDIEKACTEQLQYVRYPVAVCDIKGYPANHTFVPSALDTEGLGHIGFISTKDKQPRPDGCRRVVVYMNLARDQADFTLAEGSEGRLTLLNDLKKIGYEAEQVTILETKIWKDYNPTLPYHIGMELEKSQGQQNTLYVGSYSPFSFESVAAAEDYTRSTIQQVIANQKQSIFHKGTEHLQRAYTFFFKLPTHQDQNINQSELDAAVKLQRK